MANPEHLEILKQGVEVWNKWREENPEKKPDLSEADFAGVQLRGAKLFRANLVRANLSRTDLYSASLNAALLEDANLRGADLRVSDLRNADLRRANLAKAKLAMADLGKADLRGAILIEADLTRGDLSGATFNEADLRGTLLTGCRLTHSTFQNAKMNRKTDLTNIGYVLDHAVLQDGTEAIQYPKWYRFFRRWSGVRVISDVPLFGISYLSLFVSLLVIHGTRYYNSSPYFSLLRTDYISALDVPAYAEPMLYSSILLAIGTTVFKLMCPDVPKEFSEATWVAEHKHPRLLYIHSDLKRVGWLWLTLLCLLAGGFIAVCLIGARVISALQYLAGL